MKNPQPVLSIDVDWVNNYNQFLELIDFSIKKFKISSKIIFIEQHHNIIKYLDEKDNYIINIDHHHDIIQLEETPHELHMGNWVNYLINQQRLNHYMWIHNIDSMVELDNLHPIRQIKSFKMDPYLNSISDVNFEKIIICKSFDFIPHDNKQMGLGTIYEILKNIALNIFKEKTIIDDLSNPFSILTY